MTPYSSAPMPVPVPVPSPVPVLLSLLRAGLWGASSPFPEGLFPCPAPVWESVYLLSCRQGVCGLAYGGLLLLPPALLPPASLLARWVAAVDAIERKNRLSASVLSELYPQFPVAPVLLKGQGVGRHGRARLCDAGRRKGAGPPGAGAPPAAGERRALCRLYGGQALSFSVVFCPIHSEQHFQNHSS